MNVAGRHIDSDPVGPDDEGQTSPWSRRGGKSGPGGGRTGGRAGTPRGPGTPDPGGEPDADGALAPGDDVTVDHGANPFIGGLPVDHDNTFLGGLPIEDPDVEGDVVDLTDDPFDDDLTSQLKARVPLQLNSRSTLSLAGAVLIVAGFLGGVMVQKHFGTAAATTPSRANIAALAGGGGFGGAGGGTGGTGAGAGAGGTGGTGTGAGAGRGGTTGTIKFVDGTTVYLTNAAGDTITVKTSATTAVRLAQTAALKDLPVGATVTVQGTADSDGIITATTVTAQK